MNWDTAYAEALDWVKTVGRKRWPHFPCNDELWAVSIAAWRLGLRR